MARMKLLLDDKTKRAEVFISEQTMHRIAIKGMSRGVSPERLSKALSDHIATVVFIFFNVIKKNPHDYKVDMRILSDKDYEDLKPEGEDTVIVDIEEITMKSKEKEEP